MWWPRPWEVIEWNCLEVLTSLLPSRVTDWILTHFHLHHMIKFKRLPNVKRVHEINFLDNKIYCKLGQDWRKYLLLAQPLFGIPFPFRPTVHASAARSVWNTNEARSPWKCELQWVILDDWKRTPSPLSKSRTKPSSERINAPPTHCETTMMRQTSLSFRSRCTLVDTLRFRTNPAKG